MVLGSGLTRRLVTLAVPLALLVTGPGAAWAGSSHRAGIEGESPCTNAALSPVPFSGCTTASQVCDCSPKEKPEKPEKPKPS
jgi:hypothetical protein